MTRGRPGIRQSLFFVLLALVLLMTSLFLLFAGFTVNREIQRSSAGEMARSRDSFRELERQRQDMLLRQAALLSELPSLKALMTTEDQPTIEDAGRAFWQTSGSDLFALLRADGSPAAVYSNGRPVSAQRCASALAQSLDNPYRTRLMFASTRFFEVATEPIYFSAGAQRRLLGYVADGYELNDSMAAMIGRSPSEQVVLATPGHVIGSTLDTAQAEVLEPYLRASLGHGSEAHRLRLGGREDLVSSLLLHAGGAQAPPVYLVVLHSSAETQALLRQLDQGIVLLGLVLLAIGGVVAMLLAGTVTRPLEAMLRSTRQMGRGEAMAPTPSAGPLELRELQEAFAKMDAEVRLSQTKLMEGERQATIGRMAGSISHDLRHYLSPIYANAEFLLAETLSEGERKELLGDITDAARGMNDLLDSILTFSRTGIALHMAPDSISAAGGRALALVQAHPDAHGVAISADGWSEVEGTIDAKELQRAVYNLALNACQAARRTSAAPEVHMFISRSVGADRRGAASIRLRDNGDGVSEEIRHTLFEPFVSAGKQSGSGLGLALVKRIAEGHGGSVIMRRVKDGTTCWTEFMLSIPAVSAEAAQPVNNATLGAALWPLH